MRHHGFGLFRASATYLGLTGDQLNTIVGTDRDKIVVVAKDCEVVHRR